MPLKQSGTPVRVVLDTNILISSAINKLGIPRQLFKLWRSRKLILVTSQFQLRELTRVFHYKRIRKRYPLKEGFVVRFLSLIRKSGVVVSPETIPEATADPDDNQILAAATAGRADAIVSGDEHLLKLKKYRLIPIYSAKRFLQKINAG